MSRKLACFRFPPTSDSALQKAAALAAKQRSGNEAFAAGQWLYERGRYRESVQAFEEALEETGEQTALGGEVALWLALGYDAAGQRADCIALYKRLEDGHSSRTVRKQAYELRYILEAPKLEISADERVSIPLVSDDAAGGSYADRWARASSPRAKKVLRRWEDDWLENYRPPELTDNKFVLAATSVLCFTLSVYSAYHVRH